MGLKFADSFEQYAVNNDYSTLLQKWHGPAFYNQIQGGGVRGNCDYFTSNAYLAYQSTESDTWSFGAYVKLTNPSAKLNFWKNGGACAGALLIAPTSVAYYRGDAAALVSSSVVQITTLVWHYVTGKIVFSDTVGTVEVWVDDVKVLAISAADTTALASGILPDLPQWAYQGATYYLDEPWFASGADTIAPCHTRIDALAPNGNGSYSQFTGSDANSTDNYALVDELPFSDTDYVESGTAGEIDTYQYPDLPYTNGSVKGVQQSVRAKNSDAGARSLQFVCRIGGTDYLGGTVALASSWSIYTCVWEKNPATNAAWTVAEVNAAEFGYKTV
jgi:hypothetical protein